MSKEHDALLFGVKDIMTDTKAEVQILATLLHVKDSYYMVSDRLKEEMFYDLNHQLIFKGIKELAKKGTEIDQVTMHEIIIEKGYHKLPGAETLLSTMIQLPTDMVKAYMLEAHIEVMKQIYQRRQLHKIGGDVREKAMNGEAANEIITYLNTEIVDLNQVADEDFNAERTVMEAYEDTQKIDDTSFVKTGIIVLDEFIFGLQLTDLVILGGAASMGKTAFALRIFKNMIEAGECPAFFSLEMGKKQLITRLLAMDAEINLLSIRKKSLSMMQREKMEKTAKELSKKKFLIDDKTGDLYQILNKIRKYNIKYGTKVFVIDYLQLVNVTLGRNSSREREIATISRSLKQIARDLEVIIIALSQLSREVGKRTDTKPKLSDLRESGAIEQDADFVIFPYRPAYYENRDTSKIPFKERAEIIIAKGRGTGTKSLFVDFISQYTKYLNGNEPSPEDSEIPF
jgi:replicative DNA helicase